MSPSLTAGGTASTCKTVPAGHREHLEEVTVLEYRPAGHAVQAAMPVCAPELYVPPVQPGLEHIHCPAPIAAEFEGHAMQVVAELPGAMVPVALPFMPMPPARQG